MGKFLDFDLLNHYIDIYEKKSIKKMGFKEGLKYKLILKKSPKNV